MDRIQPKHQQAQAKHRLGNRNDRKGAALVETAVVMPVFGILMMGLVEFGHAYMTLNTVRAAAKQAARIGVADGVMTADVEARANEILSKAIDITQVTILVKSAAVFDEAEPDVANIDYDTLPDIEVNDAESRELFLVRISVPYDQVALLPPFWAKNVTLTGQSVMRHE